MTENKLQSKIPSCEEVRQGIAYYKNIPKGDLERNPSELAEGENAIADFTDAVTNQANEQYSFFSDHQIDHYRFCTLKKGEEGSYAVFYPPPTKADLVSHILQKSKDRRTLAEKLTTDRSNLKIGEAGKSDLNSVETASLGLIALAATGWVFGFGIDAFQNVKKDLALQFGKSPLEKLTPRLASVKTLPFLSDKLQYAEKISKTEGACDPFRLYVKNLEHQAMLYRRIRNSLPFLLGFLGLGASMTYRHFSEKKPTQLLEPADFKLHREADLKKKTVEELRLIRKELNRRVDEMEEKENEYAARFLELHQTLNELPATHSSKNNFSSHFWEIFLGGAAGLITFGLAVYWYKEEHHDLISFGEKARSKILNRRENVQREWKSEIEKSHQEVDAKFAELCMPKQTNLAVQDQGYAPQGKPLTDNFGESHVVLTGNLVPEGDKTVMTLLDQNDIPVADFDVEGNVTHSYRTGLKVSHEQAKQILSEKPWHARFEPVISAVKSFTEFLGLATPAAPVSGQLSPLNARSPASLQTFIRLTPHFSTLPAIK